MRSMLLLVVAVAVAGCSPRLTVGYDASAHVRGPLANLQPIARTEAVTGIDAPPPPEGRNYTLGVGFGDKNFSLGLRAHANNVSGSLLKIEGPQYVSAAAALDFRYAVLRYKGIALNTVLAPSRTFLLDSTSGTYTWGNGIRYGGGASMGAFGFALYAEAYQEKIMFLDGPATGISTRTGVTLGVAFQPR
jgi:hypothetical protein